MHSSSSEHGSPIGQIGAHSVAFNYVINAWEVKFENVDLGNVIVAPQLCAADPASSDYTSMCSDADLTTVTSCSQLAAGLNTNNWMSSSLENDVNSGSALCYDASLAQAQDAVAQTHDWVYVTTPLQVMIPYKEDKLKQFTRIQDTIYSLRMRLLILDISTLDTGIASVNTLQIDLVLHKPTAMASETLVQNACVERGLQSPKNGLLYVGVGDHGQDICLARCNWQYLRVPWNAHVPLATLLQNADEAESADAAASAEGEENAQDAQDAQASTRQTSVCVRIPGQFTASIVHIALNVPLTYSASLLPQSTLNAVDDIANSIMLQSSELSNAIVVCRVPNSYTAGPHFEFILQKFASESADPATEYEVREQPLESIDENVHAECLILTTDLNEATVAARRVMNAMEAVQKANAGSPDALPIGDYNVRRVSRLAQTQIPQAPRISVDAQRLTLVCVQVVLVFSTVTTLYTRKAFSFKA